MGKGSKAPEAPDPQETAAAEAQFNRVDTFSPSGSGVRYGFTDAAGNFQMGQPPEGQQSAVKYLESDAERTLREILEPASVDLTNRVISDNIEGMPDAARVRDRSDVSEDIFNRTFSLMSPGIDKANERLLTNLQGRGIPIGSEAFNDAYGEQLTRTQDTIARLAMDADIAAGAEQSREFGLDQAVRSSAIAEIVAAMGGGYNPPNSVPSGAVTPVNYGNMVGGQYQAELAQYQQQQNNQLYAATALGNAGVALMKCTAHAKDIHGRTVIEDAAQVIEKIPVYTWNYKPSERPHGDKGMRHVGPMAEDFAQLTGLGSSHEIDAIDFFGVLTAALQCALKRIADLEAEIHGEEDDEPEQHLEPVRVH